MSDVQAGSVVRLKSGGPVMTVTSVSLGSCSCSYSREGAIETIQDIALAALQPVVEGVLVGRHGWEYHVMPDDEGFCIVMSRRTSTQDAWKIEEDERRIEEAHALAYRSLHHR